jgi:hypothetical protein
MPPSCSIYYFSKNTAIEQKNETIYSLKMIIIITIITDVIRMGKGGVIDMFIQLKNLFS